MQPAVTLGPLRLPQTSPPLLELALVVLVADDVPVVAPLVEELVEEELVDELPAPAPVRLPHMSRVGRQTSSWLPLASGTVVQVRPEAQAWLVEQSGAQYSSPSNWAQSEPLAQSESWRQA